MAIESPFYLPGGKMLYKRLDGKLKFVKNPADCCCDTQCTPGGTACATWCWPTTSSSLVLSGTPWDGMYNFSSVDFINYDYAQICQSNSDTRLTWCGGATNVTLASSSYFREISSTDLPSETLCLDITPASYNTLGTVAETWVSGTGVCTVTWGTNSAVSSASQIIFGGCSVSGTSGNNPPDGSPGESRPCAMQFSFPGISIDWAQTPVMASVSYTQGQRSACVTRDAGWGVIQDFKFSKSFSQTVTTQSYVTTGSNYENEEAVQYSVPCVASECTISLDSATISDGTTTLNVDSYWGEPNCLFLIFPTDPIITGTVTINYTVTCPAHDFTVHLMAAVPDYDYPTCWGYAGSGLYNPLCLFGLGLDFIFLEESASPGIDYRDGATVIPILNSCFNELSTSQYRSYDATGGCSGTSTAFVASASSTFDYDDGSGGGPQEYTATVTVSS